MQVSKYWFNFIRTLLPMVSNPLGNPKTLSSPSIDTTSSILVRGGISGLLLLVIFTADALFRSSFHVVPFFLQFFQCADGEWHGIYYISIWHYIAKFSTKHHFFPFTIETKISISLPLNLDFFLFFFSSIFTLCINDVMTKLCHTTEGGILEWGGLWNLHQ